MKHLNKLLVAVMMVMGLSSHAQDSNNPWAISFELMPLTLELVLVVVKNWADVIFTTICSKRQLEYSSICFLFSVSKYIGDNFSLDLLVL
jgi:hypothetical protein